MRTTTTTSTRFNLKFFRVLSKNIQPGKLHCTIFTWKISAVIFIGEDLALRSRMTTAITFSRQNDVGSRACTTQYWENIVLVVVLVSESKALYSYTVRGRPFNSWGWGWVISGHQEFFFLAIWWAGYFFPFFPISSLLHLCCMQFSSSDKRLQEIFFQNYPPPPPQELNGRPLKCRL